jgi:hypothetical protein
MYFPAFLHWIENAPTNTIRYRSLLALHSLMGLYGAEEEQQEKILISYLPVLLRTFPTAAAHYDYDSLKTIGTVINSSMETNGFTNFIPQVVQAVLPLCLNTDLDLLVRQTFTQCISDLIESYPLLVNQEHILSDGTKTTLLPLFVKVVVGLCVEDDDDPFSIDENRPQKIASPIMEKLFEFLPRADVFQQFPPQIFELLQSPNHNYRKGAFLLISFLSQQCAMVMSQTANYTWNGISAPFLHLCLEISIHFLKTDSHPISHKAASLAIIFINDQARGLMAQYRLFHKPLTEVIELLKVVPLELRSNVVDVLDSLCETAGVELVPFLGPIMTHISDQLNLPDIAQKNAAITAITSIAFSVDTHFVPYFPSLVPLLNSIICAPESPELTDFKENALVSLSACARAVGFENWSQETRTIISDLAQTLVEGLMDGHELEYSYSSNCLTFLGNIGVVLAELPEKSPEILDVLAGIYSCAIESVRSLQGVHFYDTSIDAPKIQGFDDDSDQDDDDNEDEGDGEALKDEDESYYFDSGALQLKTSALSTLTLLLTALGPQIYKLPLKPLFDSTTEIFNADLPDNEKQDPYLPMDPVKRLLRVCFDISGSLQNDASVMIALVSIFTDILVHVISKMGTIPINAGVRHPLPQEVKEIAEPIMQFIFNTTADEDPDLVSSSLDAVNTLLQVFGASILSNPTACKEFYDVLTEIVEESSPCFFLTEFRDERADNCEEVLEEVTSLVGQLAESLGPLLMIEFLSNPSILQKLQDFCKPHRPASFRAIAIGCLAEILERCGPTAVAEFTPSLFPLALRLLTDDNPAVRHNALFFSSECARVVYLCPQLTQQLNPEELGQIFNAIVAQIFSPETYSTSEDKETHDNAVSAATNFILTWPQLFPPTLFAQVFNILPLFGDGLEVCKILLSLDKIYSAAIDIMRPLTGQWLAQIAILLHYKWHSHALQDEPKYVAIFKSLLQQFPQEAQTATNYFTNHQEALATFQQLLQ